MWKKMADTDTFDPDWNFKFRVETRVCFKIFDACTHGLFGWIWIGPMDSSDRYGLDPWIRGVLDIEPLSPVHEASSYFSIQPV